MTDFWILTLVSFACNSQSRCLLYSNLWQMSTPNCKKKCLDLKNAVSHQPHFLEYAENKKINYSIHSVKELFIPFGALVWGAHRTHRKTQKKNGLAFFSSKAREAAFYWIIIFSPGRPFKAKSLPRVLLGFFKQGMFESEDWFHLQGRRVFSRFPASYNFIYMLSIFIKLKGKWQPVFLPVPLQMFPPAHGFKSCPLARVPFGFLSGRSKPLSTFHRNSPEIRRLRLSFVKFFSFIMSSRVSPWGFFFIHSMRHLHLLILLNPSLACTNGFTLSIISSREGGNWGERVPLRDVYLYLAAGPGSTINVRRGTGFSLYLCALFLFYTMLHALCPMPNAPCEL